MNSNGKQHHTFYLLLQSINYQDLAMHATASGRVLICSLPLSGTNFRPLGEYGSLSKILLLPFALALGCTAVVRGTRIHLQSIAHCTAVLLRLRTIGGGLEKRLPPPNLLVVVGWWWCGFFFSTSHRQSRLGQRSQLPLSYHLLCLPRRILLPHPPRPPLIPLLPRRNCQRHRI